MTSRGQTALKTRSPQSPPVWTPHGYQKKAVKFLLEHAAAALLLDPGMGKTSVVLKTFMALKKAKVANKMLVIAPLRVCQLVWPQEVKEWKDFLGLKVVVLHGPKKEQRLAEEADIYVINPEGLEWLILGGKGKQFDMRRWKALGFDTLCIDELTKFKHAKGTRFKMLKLVLDTFGRRWGLTGTPAPNGLLDLFGQMFVLDMGNALGRFITHYRVKYFRAVDPNGWKWVLQAGAAELIYERLKPLAMRASAEDHLELPEIVPLKIFVDLPPAARKLYDELEEELISEVEARTIVVANAAAASMKLRQLANGAIYVDDDVASKVKGKRRTVLEMHDEKIKALSDLVDELNGQPILVGYEFNHDLARLLNHFGKDTPYIGSGVNEKRAKEIEAAWNAGEIPVLLGHPASMGHGLNFQKGSAAHVAWFAQFWDLEMYDQFVKRVRRQGNKSKRVFVHHFMAKDTVDETIYFVQRSKERTQGALLEALAGRKK